MPKNSLPWPRQLWCCTGAYAKAPSGRRRNDVYASFHEDGRRCQHTNPSSTAAALTHHHWFEAKGTEDLGGE